MAALLLLLAFLLVAGAGGGGLGTAALGTDDATRSYYSSDSEVMAYWKRVLRNSPMPLALVEHLNSFDGLSLSLMDGDDGKTTLRCGPNMDGDDGKATLRWGPNMDGDDGKATLRWGPNMDGDDGKATLRWGPNMDGDDGKATLRWGTNMDGDDGKATLRWGTNMDGDDGKATLRWGTNMDGDDGKATLRWGTNMDGDDGKATLRWGTNMDGDDGKATLRWGTNMDGDDGKATLRWGRNMDGDVEKVIDQLGSDANGDDGKATLRWRPDDQNIREGHHQVHGTGHNHGQFDLENLLFLEAVLTPGTLMAPYIEPSVVFPAPFLPREIADSIPISTKNFTDILSMFAPMSLSIASKIWSTLDTCEHPHPLEGERQACATSIESMVELAASVLGTRDVRAFSSSYVPAEGFASPLSKYKVAAVRAITAPEEEATTMTCHGVTFPYAVFYCHAVNPTRVYDVTLQSVEEDGAAAASTMLAGKKTMQALAVCHLNTSQFDPENPFFVARGLKPGDAAVCHFLSRDSVLWAPAASTQGHGQVAAQ